MAAGSVIKDPNKGTKLSKRKNIPTSVFMGMNLLISITIFSENSKIGLVAAMTIITKTNIGSVKFREST